MKDSKTIINEFAKGVERLKIQALRDLSKSSEAIKLKEASKIIRETSVDTTEFEKLFRKSDTSRDSLYDFLNITNEAAKEFEKEFKKVNKDVDDFINSEEVKATVDDVQKLLNNFAERFIK